MKGLNQMLVAGSALLLLGASAVRSAELVSRQIEQPPDLLAEPGSNRGLFKLGMFEIIPQIAGGMTYDNNIFATSDNTVDDFIWNIAPGLSAVALDAESGKTISLSYVPSFNFYTDNTDNNYTAQSASLSARLPFTKLTLGMDGSFNSQQYARVGAGELVNSDSYVAVLSSRYEIGPKTSVEVNAQANGQTGDGLINNNTFGNIDWFNYRYSEKLALGLGASFNWTLVQDASDQTFQQVLTRADYRMTEKLALNAMVGIEFRQYDGNASSTVRPVLTLGASYRATEKTTFNLSAYGRTQSSAEQTNQNYYATGFSLNAIQQFTQKLSATAFASYEYNRYFSVFDGVPSDGPTDLITAGASVNYQIKERWTVSIFYYYSHNSGNESSNNYDDQRTGIQTSWRF